MSGKAKNQKTANTKGSSTKTRNWIAVAAHFKSGAGSHKSKKTYSRKTKHKGRSRDRPYYFTFVLLAL